jgi:hypothetical protein
MLPSQERQQSPSSSEESPSDGKTRTKQNQARGLWHGRRDLVGYIRVDLNGIEIDRSTPNNEAGNRFRGSVLDVIATGDCTVNVWTLP